MADRQMTVNGRPFEILRLLGKGKGGYSYLAADETGQYVLKQIHHEPCSYYQFGNKMEAELRDYHTLLEAGIRMPRLLDADPAAERILKEYIPGETALTLVLTGGMKPAYLQQVREMCQKLYPRQLNIDYFPTNFVLREGLLYYVDFECNGYMAEWNFENWGIQYWSRTAALDAWLSQHPDFLR